jgi:hypothetical protein
MNMRFMSRGGSSERSFDVTSASGDRSDLFMISCTRPFASLPLPCISTLVLAVRYAWVGASTLLDARYSNRRLWTRSRSVVIC